MPTFESEIRPSFGQSLLELDVPSELSFKDPAIIRILRTLKENGCIGQKDSERIQLCLDEAIKNAMLHGNKYQPDKKVQFQLFADDDKWGLVIEDEGAGVTPDLVPEPVADIDEMRESGYGMIMMDSILDEVVYMGSGNQLLMVRRRSGAGGEEEAGATAVSEVSSMSDEELESASYVAPAAEREVPDSLDFDLGDLEMPEPAAPVEEKPAAAPSAITGAEVESETKYVRVLRKDGVRICEVLPEQISDFNLNFVREGTLKAAEGESVVVVDLSHVNFMSSVVLGALVNFYKELRNRGAETRLCSLTPNVQEVFQITRLDTLLAIYPDADAAIKGEL